MEQRLQQEMANSLDVEVSLSPPTGQRRTARQKLIPWLRDRVNSGQVPGVSWMDPAKTRVKIDWPRKSQHDYCVDRDGAIFKLWAVHTGRYVEGKDDPDPSKWKTNFRCAMNKSTEARYLPGESQDQGDNPFRLYRLCQPSTDDNYHLNGHHGASGSPGLDEECELRIEPHYGNDRLFCTRPSRGCLLHPPHFQRNGFHVPAELVALPQYSSGNAAKKDQYNRIFENLDRGIAFRIENNDMYVTRHCRVRVFCLKAGGSVIKLRKGVKTKVFDYDTFLAQLQDYAAASPGMKPPRPETRVYLNIGQNNPGPPDNQSLITVILRHVTAEQRLSTVDGAQPNINMYG